MAHVFQYPLPDRLSCHHSRRHQQARRQPLSVSSTGSSLLPLQAQCVLSISRYLSVSSTGSSLLPLTVPIASLLSYSTFSILYRIVSPATQSWLWIWTISQTFSILYRIVSPATPNSEGDHASRRTFSILYRIVSPATRHSTLAMTTDRYLSVSSTGSSLLPPLNPQKEQDMIVLLSVSSTGSSLLPLAQTILTPT